MEDMLKYKLTVLCPGIRNKNWEKLYNSIIESFNGRFEIIFCGPYDLPQELTLKDNIKYIKDFGSPTRAQQIALLQAKGEYIAWAADDGVFLPNALNIAFKKIEPNSVVMGKYYEGNNDGDMPMQDDAYYILSNHDSMKLKYVPKGYYMFNVGIVSRETLLKFGGFDCQFEVLPMAFNDLAIRLQLRGIKFIIQDELMFKCSHMPGHEGDHGPIHDAQTLHDEPLFKKIYSQNMYQGRIEIQLNNWERSPSRWIRRFGESAKA